MYITLYTVSDKLLQLYYLSAVQGHRDGDR